MVFSWLLLCLLSGCSVRPGPRGAVAPCTHDELSQCEAALWDLLDQPERAALGRMLREYLSRRADAWSRLYQTLDQNRRGERPAAVLVVMDSELDPGAPPPEEVTAGAPSLRLPPLPPPARLSRDTLLLVLAEAAGYEHLVWLRHDGTRWHLYPQDLLRPFAAGLPAVMIDAAGQAHPGPDVALERTLRQTLAAAAAGDYVKAAAGVDQLRGGLAVHPECQTGLRVRFALHLLSQAGLALVAPTADAAPAASVGGTPDPTAVSQKTTPYTELLQVYASREPRSAWPLRRKDIEPALTAPRRLALLRTMGGPESCHAAPPTAAGIGDLLFASTLIGALAPPSTLPTRTELSIAEWLPRYRTLVRLTTATQTGWYFAPLLAQSRGLAQGINPVAEPAYAQVTALMTQHLERLAALQQSAPQRFEATGMVSWLLWHDLISDTALAPAILSLLDSAVRGKVESGSEVATIFEGLLSAGLTLLTLPPQAQAGLLKALHEALAARLHGDLREQSGWSVAALYALDEVYRQLASLDSAIAEDGDQILRALRAPPVPYPELSRLAQAATLYATLAATSGLDPELIGEPARFGSARKEAYELLQKSLATLTPLAAAPPPEVTAAVATWVDGFLALLPLSVREAMAAEARKSQGAPPESGCRKPQAPRSPAAQRALGRLRAMRQRLLAQPWYAASGDKNLWAPRLRTLLLLLSDGLDLAMRGPEGVAFAISTPTARDAIKDALQSGGPALGTAAEPAAELYGWLRGYLGRRQGEPSIFATGLTLTALRSTLGVVQRWLKSASTAPLGGASDSILALLQTLDLSRLRAASGLPELFSELAAQTYQHGHPEAGEGMLLLGLFADLAVIKPASDVLVETAARLRSPLLPILQLYQTTLIFRAERPFDPKHYRAGLREVAAASCQEADAAQTLDILQALSDYARGEHRPARAALRQSLERAEREGLVVPRLTYHYAEQLGGKRLQLDLDLSLGGGLVVTGATNQFGIGMSSLDGSVRELRRTLWPKATMESDERAMRFYIHAATLYAIYSLLDGDPGAARWAGARVVTALEHNLLLGRRGAGNQKVGLSWDARAAIALAAQLLAEAEQPLLAGELWKEAQSLLAYSAEESADLDLFRRQSSEMLGIVGVRSLESVIERTRASLERLLPACLHPQPRRPVARRELSCSEYSLELSLRQARREPGAMALRPDEAARCPTVAALQDDAPSEPLVVLMEHGQPVEAVEALLHDFVKFPRRALDAAPELGRSLDLPPWLRVVMLQGPVLYPLKRGLQPEPDDLAALLKESAQIPGLELHGRVLRRLVDYAAEKQGLGTLREVVEARDFVTRWLTGPAQGGQGEEAATALLLQHAAAAEAGHAVELATTQGPFNLLCGRYRAAPFFDGTMRGSLCTAADKLRGAPPASLAESQERAREIYRLLAEQTAVFKR